MCKNSLKKENKMLTSNDFGFVREQSHFLRSKSLLAFYRKSNITETKLGLSISKKYGNAVKRNRLKRLIRETFRSSPFKELGIFINFTPNLKSFIRMNRNYELFESKVIKDLQEIFKSIQ